MAISDFMGSYQVRRTSGTQFGFQTTVSIRAQPGQVAKVMVSIAPPNQPAQIFAALYDEKHECLRIELEKPGRVMFVSRYNDEDANYEAIYGVVVMDNLALGLWSAELLEPDGRAACAAQSADLVKAGAAIEPERVCISYRVTSSTCTQFGLASTVVVDGSSSRPGGKWSLAIEDVLGQDIPTPNVMTFDQSNGSLIGKTVVGSSSTPVVFQASFAQVDADDKRRVKIIYGLSVIGDPEQGGIFGGEDESEPPPKK